MALSRRSTLLSLSELGANMPSLEMVPLLRGEL